jgi:hypothetical protein
LIYRINSNTLLDTMWVIIRFEHIIDIQSNQAVVLSEENLMNFMNATLDACTNAKIVMIPKASDRINRKMFPIVTSEKCDFYAQWFD